MAKVATHEVTPAVVAQYIAELLDGDRYLTEDAAAERIRARFGDCFLYARENGTPAVALVVLTVFRERYSPPARWPVD